MSNVFHQASKEIARSMVEAREGGISLAQTIEQADQALSEIEEELGKARAFRLICDVERAFAERPEIAAIAPWFRYRSFGVALASRNSEWELSSLGDQDRELDPRAVAYYAAPENQGDGATPDYQEEDFVYGAFHQAFAEFLKHPRGVKVAWELEEDQWLLRGDALSIADSLGMEWMRPWIEKAVLERHAVKSFGQAQAPRI